MKKLQQQIDAATDALRSLRIQIGKLPTAKRGDFLRLVILIALLDMSRDDRAFALTTLREFYFPRNCADA